MQKLTSKMKTMPIHNTEYNTLYSVHMFGERSSEALSNIAPFSSLVFFWLHLMMMKFCGGFNILIKFSLISIHTCNNTTQFLTAQCFTRFVSVK